MAEFPYTPKHSSLTGFLGKIQTISKPDKVTLKYIESLGFTSKNDRPIRSILISLGFMDSSGTPTDRWQVYRDKEQASAALAVAIREAYSGLFAIYPDAYRKDDEALRNFFTSNTSVGNRTVTCMVQTFKALCDLADFTSAPWPSPEPPPVAAPGIKQAIPTESPAVPQGITVNLNIQLTLPETKDSSIYDSIFESLKKHLLSL